MKTNDRRLARRATRRAAAKARLSAVALVAVETARRDAAEAEAARLRGALVLISDAISAVKTPNGTTKKLGRIAADALVTA